MIIGIPEILLGLGVVILPIACLTNWVAALKQYQAGEPLVETEYRENVPWGLLDLCVIVVIVGLVGNFLMQLIAGAMGIQNPSLTEVIEPEDQGRVFMIFGLCTIASTLLSYGWIYLRYQRLSAFSMRHIGPDIELGMRWFVMLVVPVLLVQLVLTQFFESSHPLTEMMRLTKSTSLLPVAAFTAMIAAPFFEESLFRLFLQGWLEKLHVTASRQKLGLASPADSTVLLVGGESSASMGQEPATKEELTESTDQNANPYRAPVENGSRSLSEGSGERIAAVSDSGNDAAFEKSPNVYAEEAGGEGSSVGNELSDTEERPIMWVPILVSSGLFALAHLQHGPDWVPLFFLALGLGYLYQRTKRILPCIVVHVLFNSLAIIQIWSIARQ